MNRYPRSFYERIGKRTFDIIASSMALIVLSPVLAITAITVAVKLGRPVLFTQARAGLDEQQFTMYKFRTMTDERGPNGELLDDSIRLTPFGKKLRAASLDELPELINILKGDMSTVGPRPLFIDYLPHYSSRERRRHEVRPGLTGLAQINGRNKLGWEARFEQDIEYIEQVTFKQDAAIIAATISKVLTKDGVNIESTDDLEERFDEHRLKKNRIKRAVTEGPINKK